MQTISKEVIIIFIIICSLLILILITFITLIIYRYQKKQHSYFQNLAELNVSHQNNLLQSQLEIQEQTFQNISREIHDNIGQKLTLAKLHLNTLSLNDQQCSKVNSSIDLISGSINDLRDISRSMSSELIMQNGLIRALEYEVNQLTKLGLYQINLFISSDTIFLESNKELVLFRIVQEALNNILKHSQATQVDISLNFEEFFIKMKIHDNGKGFLKNEYTDEGLGLKNMYKRAKLLHGECSVVSDIGIGTTINIKIPINEYKEVI